MSDDCPHEEHRPPWWRGVIVEEPRATPDGWEITMRVVEASDPATVGELRTIHRPLGDRDHLTPPDVI